MAELGKSFSLRLKAALADSFLGGIIAFALFSFVLGLRTVDSVTGLTLQPRPMLLAIAVGTVFFGRLLLNLFVWQAKHPLTTPFAKLFTSEPFDRRDITVLGINTTVTKLTAFATGALFGGLAGDFFATRQGFISPESFTFIESAIILAIVVLGGMGSQLGVAIAAVLMVGGFEALRHTDGLQSIFGDGFDPALYRMLLFGIAMVGIMVWRPRGIIASRSPTILLDDAKEGLP